jgi:hypothetical protein
MLDYTPDTSLEAAVLKSGRFVLSTDTAGREVVSVGHRRLPKVVLPQKADGLHALMQEVSATGARAFTVTEGDPWRIEEAEEDPEDGASPAAAEEYLVMGVRPLRAGGRPIRVAVQREVVRLYVLPWSIPARTLHFGGDAHFIVTSTRGVVGDWQVSPDGRTGVIVGVPELWVGVLERLARPDVGLVLRSDVPVPWIGDDGLCGAAPTTVGVFERAGVEGAVGAVPDSAGNAGPAAAAGESWLAKLPVVMTEGNVVRPVPVPADVEIGEVPDGPWELEAQGGADFSMGSLT